MKSSVFLVFFASLVSLAEPQRQFLMHEKPSLKKIAQDFSTTKSPSQTQVVFEAFRAQVRDSEAFVRNEIDDKATYDGILRFLDSTLENCQKLEAAKKHKNIQEDLSVWMNFAADFSYEESTHQGLLFSNKIRSKIFDYIEQNQRSKIKDWIADEEGWLQWAMSFRAPWPIDRVILNGVSKLKSPKAQYTARKIVSSLQKNAYQTYAQALHEAQGPKLLELKEMESLWTSQDIELMKSESNRLNLMQLRFATALYEKKFKQEPSRLENLVEMKILSRIPLDYFSGMPFTLEQVKKP